jgi:hypothetical protein
MSLVVWGWGLVQNTEAVARNYYFQTAKLRVQQCLLLECILRLNKAGRSYLIQDPTSKEGGFHVLLKVPNDLNCLFLHLQENPLLCSTLLTADGRAPQPLVSREEEYIELVY